jgi:hypothetical protein
MKLWPNNAGQYGIQATKDKWGSSIQDDTSDIGSIVSSPEMILEHNVV